MLGYGWTLNKVLQAARNAIYTHKYILFTEALASYLYCDPDELVRKFKSFNHKMVVSGDTNLWPYSEFVEKMPEMYTDARYKFPNSGAYMAEIPYLLELFDTMGIEWKSDCVDDQGELIKALVLNNNAFKIDSNAVLFQTLFGLPFAVPVLLNYYLFSYF